MPFRLNPARPVAARAIATCLLLFPPTAAATAEAPRIVASIKPIHSLVASVMGGVGQPSLLIKGASSPHSYSLRPSDARHLSDAKLIFWVGERMETFLDKPLTALAGKAAVVALAKAKGMRLLKAREGGLWEAHDEHGKKPANSHDREDDARDEHNMHIWLDPANAAAMVRAIEAALVKADPVNAKAYRANATAAVQRLSTLDAELRAAVAPVRTRPYIVFHDAYQYLEARYDLAAAGSITVDPARRPGARRLRAIRKRLAAGRVRCVFREPQFPAKIATVIVAGTNAKLAVLDPIGAEIPAGPDAYFTLMRNLAGSLKRCLR